MKTLLPRVRHLPFYEALASTDPSSELWHATAAGLYTLRLVDTWCRRSRDVTRVSKRALRAVAELVNSTEGEARQRLLRVVSAIESDGADSERVAALALLDHAIALRLEMEWGLAIDVSRTIVEKLGKNIDHEVVLEATLQWAVGLRLAGRFDEARGVYRVLRRLAQRFQSATYLLRTQLGLANILLERGNFPAAQSAVDAVIAVARSGADTTLRGVLSRALHTRAAITHARGWYAESVANGYEALDLCDDSAERESILHDIAASFIGLGCLAAARDVFVLLRRTAINSANRWAASVNLMEIAALEGRTESFEAWRRELENQRLRPLHRAHFLCLAGEGYERLGQYERALEMYGAAVFAGEMLGINEVIIRAEARANDVRAKKYLPAGVAALPVCEDVEQVIEAVAELRMAAGIAAEGEDP